MSACSISKKKGKKDDVSDPEAEMRLYEIMFRHEIRMAIEAGVGDLSFLTRMFGKDLTNSGRNQSDKSS
jgi:hypothetical protein